MQVPRTVVISFHQTLPTGHLKDEEGKRKLLERNVCANVCNFIAYNLKTDISSLTLNRCH